MKVQKNTHSFSFTASSLSAPTCNLATCAASFHTLSISSSECQLRYSDQNFSLSSTSETAPPSFPKFPRVQHPEEAGLSLPTESAILCSWDPVVVVSAENLMADIHRRSMHQQPSAPVPIPNIELLISPWLQNLKKSALPPTLFPSFPNPRADGHYPSCVCPFDNPDANCQELSRNVTVPEDQVHIVT
ncbi:hypothetical protein BO71DRAFT_434047 [Aspergillus ellipticus CBS 707.79]|uniref:Uncharacterized protein n=1 Tax=Aspergillus ellipticus CBS 707.79 TaxID=1448320 RepID=A0A319CYX7_9EURO|nr:hypothetical protein BO71DRAFT_434047 [Aspergillus ellipticus CBS 707.79]